MEKELGYRKCTTGHVPNLYCEIGKASLRKMVMHAIHGGTGL
jgi:hypothetical protein